MPRRISVGSITHMGGLGHNQDRPRWAPRVPRHKIAKLYRWDARGLQDQELADEVGYAFLVRIEDCLTVTEGHHGGRITCPECGAAIERQWGHRERRHDELLDCPNCPWQLPWREYHRSYRKKHMLSAGLEAFFRDFALEFPKARKYGEKMVLIDQLLHRYHWELEGEPGGPAAVNLIGGTRNEVLAFLNELTYGKGNTPGLSATRQRWRTMMNWGGWSEETADELSKQYRPDGQRPVVG